MSRKPIVLQDAVATDGVAEAVAWDIIYDDFGCYYTVDLDGLASETICPDEDTDSDADEDTDSDADGSELFETEE